MGACSLVVIRGTIVNSQVDGRGRCSGQVAASVEGLRPLQENPTYESTSASLLVRVRDPADEQAWRDFVARYDELIFRYCLRRGLQPADCEDVRQAVWVNLSKGLRTFEYNPARGRFRNYLGKTVRSAIFRHFSRYGSPDQALSSGVLASVPNGEGDEHDEHWQKEWVDHHYRLAMGTIEWTFDEKSVMVFRRLIGGEPTDRVAVDFGMTVAAVHQAKHRIRSRMRELIAQQIREEDEPDSLGPT